MSKDVLKDTITSEPEKKAPVKIDHNIVLKFAKLGVAPPETSADLELAAEQIATMKAGLQVMRKMTVLEEQARDGGEIFTLASPEY